jgi:hypothetical protein
VVVVGVTTPAQSAAPPRLTIAGETVQGTHFARRDRVRVTLRSGAATQVRHVRASRQGAFTVTFAAAATGPCGGMRLRAVGSSGRSAVLAHRMLPGCIAY